MQVSFYHIHTRPLSQSMRTTLTKIPALHDSTEKSMASICRPFQSSGLCTRVRVSSKMFEFHPVDPHSVHDQPVLCEFKRDESESISCLARGAFAKLVIIKFENLFSVPFPAVSQYHLTRQCFHLSSILPVTRRQAAQLRQLPCLWLLQLQLL